MMTTEEKAKAYDEALSKCKAYIDDTEKRWSEEFSRATEEVFKEIFPQLRESEDERIRKEIISALKFANDGGVYDRHIAYLEKQKHSLNFDAISSWLRDHASNYVNGEFNEFHHCVEYDGTINVEKLIADLKVAVSSATFDVHEQKEQKPVEWDKLQEDFRNINEAFEAGKKEVVANPEKYSLCKPAEWSFPYGVDETVDKLIAIAECLEMDGDCLFNGHTGTECGKFLRDLARKQVECKPAEWSEEDEEMIQDIIAAIDTKIAASDFHEMERWLKSLRPSWKPSDEQIRPLEYAIAYFKKKKNDVTYLESLYQDLLTLRKSK